MDKRTIRVIATAVFISICVVIIPWLIAFHSNPFSTAPADWGIFGDYLGGVLATIISILGFVAVIITIRVQNEGIKAQLAGLELDQETRDDAIYKTQALECLEQAFLRLNDATTGRPIKDRTAWLETARLILTARELAGRITSESMLTAFNASARLVRSKFMSLLDQKNCPETIQPNYFTGPSDAVHYRKVNNQLEKRSVYVIYKFASWPRHEHDPIDDVDTDYSADPINMGYFGATEYLKPKP
jgi:uncharacterized membrane protein